MIRREVNFINSSSRLASTYFTHLAFRSFSCTGYTSWKVRIPRTPQEKTESDRVSQRLWRAKNKDAIKEKKRKAYEAGKAALSQSGKVERANSKDSIKEKNRRYYEQIKAAVSHYQNRTGALEASSKAEAKRRVYAERKVERERQRVQIVAEGERRRAERKAERAESARRRAAEETELELRREQRAERKRHLEHQKAIRAQQQATSRAATAEINRGKARQKAAEYRKDFDYRKAVVAGEQQRRIDPDYAQRQDMRTWLLRCSQRDRFSWKTHVPVVYEDKTVKTCTACGKTRRAGSRLWWKSLVSPDTYECHLCYAADCSRAMPRGFEDFRFGTKKHLKP